VEGKTEEAISRYRTAMNAYRGLQVPMYLALCQGDMAVALGPDHAEAATALNEARAFWTNVGATEMLDRLDEAVAKPRSGRPSTDAAPVAESVETSASA
jgi:hypothetical protein